MRYAAATLGGIGCDLSVFSGDGVLIADCATGGAVRLAGASFTCSRA